MRAKNKSRKLKCCIIICADGCEVDFVIWNRFDAVNVGGLRLFLFDLGQTFNHLVMLNNHKTWTKYLTEMIRGMKAIPYLTV